MSLMERLRQYDGRMMRKMAGLYPKKNREVDKPHSFLTGIVLFFFYLIFPAIFLVEKHVVIVSIPGLFLYVWFIVQAVYLWRSFLHLRRKGRIKDRNLFFAESAGLYRKLAFYVALGSLLVMRYSGFVKKGDWPHMAKAEIIDYLWKAGLMHLVFFAVLIEFLRTFMPTLEKMNKQRHVIVVMVCALGVSALDVFMLKKYLF